MPMVMNVPLKVVCGCAKLPIPFVIMKALSPLARVIIRVSNICQNLHLFCWLSQIARFLSKSDVSNIFQNVHSHFFCCAQILKLLLAVIFSLNCVFSNVSSKRLHDRMHSHIGCISLTFRHCVFSNVSSNRLHKRMHNHNGCICMTLLYSLFPDASSNGLLLRIHLKIHSGEKSNKCNQCDFASSWGRSLRTT